MKAFLFSLLTLLLISCTSTAQQKIIITIEDAPNETFELKLLKGEQQLKLSEAIVNNNQLIFTGDFESGLYAIFNKDKGISFIINEPEIHLKTNWQQSYPLIEVIESKENDYWFTYKKHRDAVFNKLKLLQPITIHYDKSSALYQEAKKEFYTIQKQLADYAISIDTSTLAHTFINADLRPALTHDTTYELQKNELKSKWFKHLNWNDERLINSDIFPSKIDAFMGLFFNKELSIKAQEDAFKKGIDILLNKAKANSKLQEYVLSYLVKKLETYQMENVILHLAKNYINTTESCEKESSDSEVIKRLKRFEQLRIGNIAPDIIGFDLDDKTVHPLNHLTDKNLIVFWSSQCVHCRIMMPKINTWYTQAKQKGWNVITVSLDTDKTLLEKAITELDLDLPIVTDYKGWDSKIAIDYNVNATPAMFILNKQRKILGKPNWLADLNQYD